MSSFTVLVKNGREYYGGYYGLPYDYKELEARMTEFLSTYFEFPKKPFCLDPCITRSVNPVNRGVDSKLVGMSAYVTVWIYGDAVKKSEAFEGFDKAFCLFTAQQSRLLYLGDRHSLKYHYDE